MREIDRCIRECERFIERVERSDSIRGARQIVDEVYGAMSHVPNIKRGMRKFQMSTDFSAPYSDADAAHDIRVLAGKLRAHRDDIDREERIAKLNAAQRGATVIIQDVGNSSSVATATSSVTLSQTIEVLDRCDITEDELRDIKAAIYELEAAKGKSPETVLDKTSKLLDLVKKAADTAKAVAPYAAMALQALV